MDADEDDGTLDVPSLGPHITSHKPPEDYAKLRPLFGWLSTETIKKTFEQTTQYAHLPSGTTLLKCSFKSSNPAMNVPCRKVPDELHGSMEQRWKITIFRLTLKVYAMQFMSGTDANHRYKLNKAEEGIFKMRHF